MRSPDYLDTPGRTRTRKLKWSAAAFPPMMDVRILAEDPLRRGAATIRQGLSAGRRIPVIVAAWRRILSNTQTGNLCAGPGWAPSSTNRDQREKIQCELLVLLPVKVQISLYKVQTDTHNNANDPRFHNLLLDFSSWFLQTVLNPWIKSLGNFCMSVSLFPLIESSIVQHTTD